MNAKKWLLSIAILAGLTLSPIQAHAGCGLFTPGDCVKAVGDLIKKGGDALQNFADAPAKVLTSIGIPPAIAYPLAYVNPVNLVSKGMGMGMSALGNYLNPPQQTVSTKSSTSCDSSISCCIPDPVTKTPPSQLPPVKDVLAAKKVGVAVAKAVEEALKKLAKEGKTPGKPGYTIITTADGTTWVDDGKGGKFPVAGPGKTGGKDGFGPSGPGSIDGGGVAPPGEFKGPLEKAAGGGYFTAEPGKKGGAGVSDLSGAGFGKVTGMAMEGGSTPVGFIQHSPKGAAGAQKGGSGGGPTQSAADAKSSQGSASVGLNAKFAGDGSFVGGGQGVAGGLGIGTGGGIQRGPSVTDAEKSVPELPVDGPPEGQGVDERLVPLAAPLLGGVRGVLRALEHREAPHVDPADVVRP
ncbi:MAG: hypothetical protein AAB576_08115, partial [Elusimicrobiota bacterium]